MLCIVTNPKWVTFFCFIFKRLDGMCDNSVICKCIVISLAYFRSQDLFLPYSKYVGMFSEPFATCVCRDLKVWCGIYLIFFTMHIYYACFAWIQECVENECTIFYLLLPDVYKQVHIYYLYVCMFVYVVMVYVCEGTN